MSSRRYRIGVLICLLGAAVAAGAATYRRMTFEALLHDSDYVIYGRVLESQTMRDATTHLLWTRTLIQVLDGPKGQPGKTVAVTEPGGILDGVGELYPGTPQFQADQEVVLFLYRAPGGRVRVTGLLQGVYAVVKDGQTGERLVLPAAAPSEVIYEDGSPKAPIVNQPVRSPENLSRFLYTVRLKALAR